MARDEGGQAGIHGPKSCAIIRLTRRCSPPGASALWPIVPGRHRAHGSFSMVADANRCLICGDLQPANAPEGLCPRCLMLQAMTVDTPVMAEVEVTTVQAD